MHHEVYRFINDYCPGTIMCCLSKFAINTHNTPIKVFVCFLIILQAQSAEKRIKSECLVHMAELSHETAQLQRLKKTNKQFNDDMKEKV